MDYLLIDSRCTRRARPRLSWTAVLCFLVTAFPPQSAKADSLSHFTVQGCPVQFTNKVWTALNYIFQTTSMGVSLPTCGQDARTRKQLVTRQEFSFVGPYVACNTSNPRLRDPELFYTRPEWTIGFALGYLADAFRPGYPSPINIICSSSTRDTAWTDDRYHAGHTNPITIFLGARTYSSRPTHQGLTNALPDFGPNFNYRDIEPSYPVDELAGIIAHEIMHTHGFSHGSSSFNECGYTSYECNGSVPGRSCRANSLPEIIEACVSEVVEESVARCSWDTTPFNYPGGLVPTRGLPVLYYSATNCSFEASTAARDGSGYLQSTFEQDTDRVGLDYASFAAGSVEQCRETCVDDTNCRAFTYVPTTGICWLKNAAPSPRFTAGMTSAVVRTPLLGGIGEYNVDRPGGDYSNFPLNGSGGLANCAKACVDQARCRSASYVVQGPDGSGQCWLKGSVPAASTGPGIVSFTIPGRLPAPGDVNEDGEFNCGDIAIVKAALGKRTGQPGFDVRADAVTDGVIDLRDLAFVSRKLAAGTRC